MDQLSDYITAIEDRDLDIWTRQPGNEVVRNAVDEWREECKMIAERIRMTNDAVMNQWTFRNYFHYTFIFSMLIATYEIFDQSIHYWWVAYGFLLLLEALLNLCWVIYECRCSWRLCKALRSDINKFKVYKNRIDMLNQKREFFSFEDDAKEYDPSSNSPPKLTRFLLDCVGEVFWGLVVSILGLIVWLVLYTWKMYQLEGS